MVLGRKKEASAAGAAPVPTGPPRVLVVNDDPAAVELLARILLGAGARLGEVVVERAVSYAGALAALSATHPDVLVADIATGGLGPNLRLVDAVRTHPDAAVRAVRVVVASFDERDEMVARQAGAVAFLGRPFHADDLIRVVGDNLAARTT